MLYLERAVEDVKKDLPTLIGKGYELIKKLKEKDLKYRKEIGIIFEGENAFKVYKEEKEKIGESIEKILGDTEMRKTYTSNTLLRVDYSPSEIF